MFKIINVFEIIIEYIRNMKEDLKPLPFIVNLIIIPLVVAFMLFFLIDDIEKFSQVLIIFASIFTLLFINVLMLVYYSIENIELNSKDELVNIKLDFLKHINSTTSMVLITSVCILFISLIISNLKINSYLYFLVKFFLMYLVGFMFLNILIIILRIFKLINFKLFNR